MLGLINAGVNFASHIIGGIVNQCSPPKNNNGYSAPQNSNGYSAPQNSNSSFSAQAEAIRKQSQQDSLNEMRIRANGKKDTMAAETQAQLMKDAHRVAAKITY